MKLLKKLLSPKIIIPTLLSAGFLALLLSLADARKVGSELFNDIPRTVVPVVFLTLLYLLVKGLQWWLNLTRLGISADWRELLVPYAGGEIGNNLPMGVYMENFLLKGALGADIWQSSAATTWMLIMEIVLCLLTLLVAGVPGWLWLRPLAAVIAAGMLLFGLGFFKSRLVDEWLSAWRPRWKWLRAGVEGAAQFLKSGRQLFALRTFLYGIPMTMLYLGAYATTLYVVGRGLVPTFGWRPALAGYAFSVLVVLLLSFLPNLGSVEAAGTLVLAQFGIDKSLGVGIFLIMRVLTTGTIALVCVLVFLCFHRQVGRMLTRLSARQKGGTRPAGPEGDSQKAEA